MSNPVELAVKVTTDTSGAVADFDKVAKSAKDMGDAVDKAGSDAQAGASKMDGAAASADNMATKSSVATGALGALAAGFELVGLDQYAAGLEKAAMATDFLSGVGDSLTLVMESQAVASTVAKVKQVALTVATQAQTAAQWLLNAAMSANPIMLVVIAAVALTAAFIILWKKSETFREAVTKLGETAKDVFNKVVGWVGDVIDKIGDLIRKIPDLFAKIGELPGKVRDAVDGAKQWLGDLMAKVGDVIGKVGDLFAKIADLPGKARDAVQGAIGWFADLIGKIGDVIGKVGEVFAKIGELPGKARDAVEGAIGWFKALLTPIQDVIDKIGDLIDWIGRIKIPHINIPGVGGRSAPAPATSAAVFGFGARSAGVSSTAGGAVGAPLVNITVQGAVDPYSTARQITQLLNRAGLITGRLTP